MNQAARELNMKLCVVVFLLVCAVARNADAYVDPGTTGMLSQLLYVLFYGLLGVFLYSLRYLKQIMANLRRFLFKSVGKKME